MEATVCLDFAKRYLTNSESMREKVLWLDETKLNSLGRTPGSMSGEQAALITC